MSREESAVNRGRTASFPALAVPGGFRTSNNVQLISARIDYPRTVTVTMLPLVRRGSMSVPWSFAGDGLVPTGATVLDPLPIPARFRAKLLWGVGGVRAETQFDYPTAGACFTLTADTLDLDVIDPNAAATLYLNDGEMPVFGAFWVDDASPNAANAMRWSDVASQSIATGQTAIWTIKPWARWLTLCVLDPTASVKVSFEDNNGNVVGCNNNVTSRDATHAGRIPVPAGCTLLRVLNDNVASQIVVPIWDIQLG